MRGFLLLSFVLISSFVLFSTNAQEVKKKPAPGTVKCYVCNSLTKGEEDCASSDEEKLKRFLKTCPKITDGQLAGRDATMCRKILQEVHEQEGIIRECSYTGEDELDGKRRIGNKGIILYLYQCDIEDGKPCNSASGLSSFVALSIGLLVAAAAKFC